MLNQYCKHVEGRATKAQLKAEATKNAAVAAATVFLNQINE